MPIYDTTLNVFIKANASVNTVIASSYNYLIDNGLYEDCTVNATYIDGRSMLISLLHMKDPSGTNEFQIVYVNLKRMITSSPTVKPTHLPTVMPTLLPTFKPTIFEPPTTTSGAASSDSLSGGEAAGAAIGAIIGTGFLVGIVYYFYVKFTKKQAFSVDLKKLDEDDRESYTPTTNVLLNNMNYEAGQFDL